MTMNTVQSTCIVEKSINQGFITEGQNFAFLFWFSIRPSRSWSIMFDIFFGAREPNMWYAQSMRSDRACLRCERMASDLTDLKYSFASFLDFLHTYG